MRDSIEKGLSLVDYAAQGQPLNVANNNGLLTIDHRSSNGTINYEIRYTHPSLLRSSYR